MSHFDDKVDFELENVFQFVENEGWRHVTVDQNMFGPIPNEGDFEFWMILQKTVEILAYIAEQQVSRTHNTPPRNQH